MCGCGPRLPAFLHYTTNTDGSNFDPHQQEAAHKHMLAFSRLAQKYMGHTMMNLKLHSIVCR